MKFNNILSETSDHITTITINRPTKLNALNKETTQELNLAFKNAEGDSGTKVIIITGSGEKAFVARRFHARLDKTLTPIPRNILIFFAIKLLKLLVTSKIT